MAILASPLNMSSVPRLQTFSVASLVSKITDFILIIGFYIVHSLSSICIKQVIYCCPLTTFFFFILTCVCSCTELGLLNLIWALQVATGFYLYFFFKLIFDCTCPQHGFTYYSQYAQLLYKLLTWLIQITHAIVFIYN